MRWWERRGLSLSSRAPHDPATTVSERNLVCPPPAVGEQIPELQVMERGPLFRLDQHRVEDLAVAERFKRAVLRRLYSCDVAFEECGVEC